ncbi:GH36-type glycosyl hydrolase domain-containing protein [Virgibacillus flavescens]|uniref:GH36-type glycosyl hydrolase domain-containing protein n=1 Tax=Virgibacillus flavescens TaxID=1611422 RepID=UPI003D336C8E
MSEAKFTINEDDLQFTFLSSGDLYEISHKHTMINQVLSNQIDGALNNIYLRIFESGEIKVYPLLGVKSSSTVTTHDSGIIWQGSECGVKYEVRFRLSSKGIWFWDVELNGENTNADIIYGQDLGLADRGAVRSNEAYMSQYMDHTIFEDKQKGYIVCTRQNQPMSDGYLYIQQGSLSKTASYSTDGFQFFGKSFKTTNQPEVLTNEYLASEVYQYEFAYTALQSERLSLSGHHRVVFYGLFKADHPSAVTSLEYETDVQEAWTEVNNQRTEPEQQLDKIRTSSAIGATLQTKAMTEEEINEFFPDRHQEEYEDETRLSFFTDTYEHVILKEKEQRVERPHGHILMSGQNDKLKEDTITTTSFMYGIFNSQLTIGNTSMNKMLSNVRNPLNIMKTSGQRIYVELDNTYHLLTMPSMFELGFNYARWYYKTDDDMLIITNFTTVDTPYVQLQVKSASGKAYNYVVTNQVTMNNNEYEQPFQMKKAGNTLTFTADSAADSSEIYPDLSYRMHVKGADIQLAEEHFLAENALDESSLVILKVSSSSEWVMGIEGLLDSANRSWEKKDFAKETERYRSFFSDVMKGFELSNPAAPTEELQKMNATAWWYTHNMLVHFSVPRGLEQYIGAAWGTRDVCQGPTEYFMATHNYQSVKEIIEKVFSHQYEDAGNWPQWFMFDKYGSVQQAESHGDVIVWPLKVVADYLEATNDYAILEQKIPYTERTGFGFTDKTDTLLAHVKKAIDYIKEEFIHETYLSSYGDGDWDDTLQPANAQLKEFMVSSWTVALTYQVLNKLAKALTAASMQEADALHDLAAGIKRDYKRYIHNADVLPGFVYMEKPGEAEFMLYPTDSKTGINYRLLPMMRGIISELLTAEDAKVHDEIIKTHLYFPDGVRLMDRPAKYTGGVSTHFKRAEQAANFGREIGLQYVHANIRYVEAMAKLGQKDEVWRGLAVINPIGIRDVVPNAEIRQSNSYFSSSDGKFNTRYEAQENFDKLRDGSVAVKGGWRIYSSGPGIYMNQLISNSLGIRQEAGNLIIDPVLPAKLNGLQFKFTFMNHQVTFIYHLNHDDKHVVVNGKSVETNYVSNPYRDGGFIVERASLDKLLTPNENKIEIYL